MSLDDVPTGPSKYLKVYDGYHKKLLPFRAMVGLALETKGAASTVLPHLRGRERDGVARECMKIALWCAGKDSALAESSETRAFLDFCLDAGVVTKADCNKAAHQSPAAAAEQRDKMAATMVLELDEEGEILREDFEEPGDRPSSSSSSSSSPRRAPREKATPPSATDAAFLKEMKTLEKKRASLDVKILL